MGVRVRVEGRGGCEGEDGGEGWVVVRVRREGRGGWL